jgi:predicted site-specific integrase-resolvase
MASGHRRISVKSVKEYAVGGEGQESLDGQVVGYCRTSGQTQKESLARQIVRLKDAIGEREGLSPDNVIIYQECCSSFGERPKLQELVLAVIGGRVRKIYVEHYNRLTRVKALGTMLEFLAEHHGCQIIALDREESVDELQNNIQELIDFVHCLGCKHAAQKSAMITTKHLPAKTVERIAELSNQGMTQKQITSIIHSENHLTVKGEKISRSKVRQYILLNGKVKSAVGIDPQEQTSIDKLIREWCSANLVKDEGGRMTVKQILPRYNAHAAANGKAPLTLSIVGRWMVANGYSSYRAQGYRYFKVSFA